MILIFFGPPGSGKGTQAQAVANEFQYNYIATGNLLRKEISSGSVLGGQVKSVIDSGQFISDEILLDVFTQEFVKNLDRNIILDGIPRTVNQAEALDKIFEKYGMSISHVFNFQIEDQKLYDRITGRYSCKTCGATYHEIYNPTTLDGVCNYCGSHDFIVRQDDTEEVLKKRLELYYLETLPILSYYKEKSILRSINAELSLSEVNEQIKKYLK